MKKFLIFLFLIMVLFYSKNYNNNFSLTDYFNGEYCCYTNTPHNKSINLGFCYLNNEDISKSNIIGESITIKNLEIGSALKQLKAKVIKTEYLQNNTIVIYAFSPLINDCVEINNKKINLQIATSNNSTTIGWPLILGSF